MAKGYFYNTPAKTFGILHTAFGGLIILLGICARIPRLCEHWTSDILLAIWTGAIILSCGVAGLISSFPHGKQSKRCQIILFLCMSVMSVLCATVLTVCYATAAYYFFTGNRLGEFDWYTYRTYDGSHVTKARVITTTMLVLAVAEFFLSFASTGHCCVFLCMREPQNNQEHKKNELAKNSHPVSVTAYENHSYESAQEMRSKTP